MESGKTLLRLKYYALCNSKINFEIALYDNFLIKNMY